MHWYRPAALKPCKTLWLRSSALPPWALGCDYAVIYHSLVKIQIKVGAVLLQPELVPWEPRPWAPAKGLLLSAARSEGSIVSFTVFQERKIHLESDQKIYFYRREVILSGLDHMDVCICHL